MKKSLLLLLISFSIYSCQKDSFKVEYYPNGNLKLKVEINEKNVLNGKYEEYFENGNIKKKTFYSKGLIADTVYSYYENKNIKEKGLIKGKNRIGWWYYYDLSGKLNEKTEFIIKDDESFLNQSIYFDKDNSIDYSRSSFFKLNIKDTLNIGKNIASLNYYSNSKNFDLQFIYIIIENEYSNGLVKRDTFTDDISKLWFGINAYKKGKLRIKGVIQEELGFTKNKNSSEYIIKKNNKYFEKEVYVKD